LLLITGGAVGSVVSGGGRLTDAGSVSGLLCDWG
jgi:hypothetical protein